MTPYMVGKLAPISSHFTRGLVKYVPGRGYFRAVSYQNGNKFLTSPPPPIVELVILEGIWEDEPVNASTAFHGDETPKKTTQDRIEIKSHRRSKGGRLRL